MSAAGRKIIEGLNDALKGNFARVTIEGTTWVPRDAVRTAVEQEIGRYVLSLIEPEKPVTRDGQLLVTAFKRLATTISSGAYRKEP